MNGMVKTSVKVILIIAAFFAVHLYPELWLHVAFAIPAAIIVEFINRNSGKYASLKGLQGLKMKFREYRIKTKIKHSLKNEKIIKYRENLIENALIKILSSNKIERKLGHKQLQQIGNKYAYNELLKIIKKEEFTDKSIETEIVNTLCDLCANVRVFNEE